MVHQTIVPYQLYVDKSNFDDKVGAHVMRLLCYLHRLRRSAVHSTLAEDLHVHGLRCTWMSSADTRDTRLLTNTCTCRPCGVSPRSSYLLKADNLLPTSCRRVPRTTSCRRRSTPHLATILSLSFTTFIGSTIVGWIRPASRTDADDVGMACFDQRWHIDIGA